MKSFWIAARLFRQLVYAGIKGTQKGALLTTLVELRSSQNNFLTQCLYVAYMIGGVVTVSVLSLFLSSWTTWSYSRLPFTVVVSCDCRLNAFCISDNKKEWYKWNVYWPFEEVCQIFEVQRDSTTRSLASDREICSAAFAHTLAQFSVLSLTMTSD